jgi:hypothetical protein
VEPGAAAAGAASLQHQIDRMRAELQRVKRRLDIVD